MEESLSCHTCSDTIPRFFWSHPKECLIQLILRHTRGCGGSNLNRTLTGPHSVAFYDAQRDAEDLFLPGSSRMSNKMYMHVYCIPLLKIKFCTWPPICSIINLKVHICIDPNFTVHSRIDRIYYATDMELHDLSAAQVIYVTDVIDFLKLCS
jgi:hypothetical protein